LNKEIIFALNKRQGMSFYVSGSWFLSRIVGRNYVLLGMEIMIGVRESASCFFLALLVWSIMDVT